MQSPHCEEREKLSKSIGFKSEGQWLRNNGTHLPFRTGKEKKEEKKSKQLLLLCGSQLEDSKIQRKEVNLPMTY